MAFKLKFQGKSKELYGSDNSMVRKGLVTPTYLMEGPGDKKPVKTQKELDAEAAAKAQANMKVVKTETKKVEGGTETTEFLEGEGESKGFSKDPAERAKQKQWIKDNPELYQKMLAEKKLKDQRTTFVPDEPADTPDDTPEITYTTTENPRKLKTQDYIVGQGDKVFAPPSKPRLQNLSKLLTGKATSFGFKDMSEKELIPYKEAYDKKVLDSRAVQGDMGKNYLTTSEQEAKENINKLGGGRSKIVDTKSGKGQTTQNQNIVKDAQGNMILQTFNKRGKVIATEPLSPENDIRKNESRRLQEINASTASGQPAVVETQSFVNRNNTVANAIDPVTLIKGAMVVKNLIDKKKNK